MSSSDNIHEGNMNTAKLQNVQPSPQSYPHTATDFLQHAAGTLAERGKQYDVGGKQERSMGKAVAAFNAVHDADGAQLTEQQGWAFMLLLKLVRGAHKPHADSALDLVGYSALYAECVAGELALAANVNDAPSVDALMATINEGTKYCPFCDAPHDLTDGSCRACGYEWEDAEQPIAQGSSMARADALEDLWECATEASVVDRMFAGTMPSAVTMEWMDEVQRHLTLITETAHKAYLQLRQQAAEPSPTPSVDAHKDCAIADLTAECSRYRNERDSAIVELSVVRAECAELRQDAEAQSKAFTESRLRLERAIGAERAQVAKLRAHITDLSN